MGWNEWIQTVLAISNRFPLFNSLAHAKKNYNDLSFEVACTSFQRKQTNKYKEKFVILQSIGIIAIKVRKWGWSPTPANISEH